MASQAAEIVLAYDSNCGPCSLFRSTVGFLDARRRIEFVSLEAADRSGLLEGITPASRYASFHLIRPGAGLNRDAELSSGSDAVLPLLRLLSPWGRAVSNAIENLPGGPAVVAIVYARLAKLHRTCSLEARRDIAVSGGSG